MESIKQQTIALPGGISDVFIIEPPLEELVFPHFPAPEMDVTNGEQGFSYCSLRGMLDYLRQPLEERGLTLSQPILLLGERWCAATVVRNREGYVVGRSVVPVLFPDSCDNQRYGGSITYAKKYSLMNLFGWPGTKSEDPDAPKSFKA